MAAERVAVARRPGPRTRPPPRPRTDGGEARGPLRPHELATVRTRQGKRLGSHKFRAADLALLTVVSGLAVLGVSDWPVGGTPLGQVVPVVAGAASAARLLRSLRLYRFPADESLVGHLLRVLVAVVGAGTCAWVLVALLDGDESARAAVPPWMAVLGVGFLALHTVWWTLVRRWRRAGLLTPNAVIVGATAQAERLVQQTIERRDLHVLGVFDDRLARSPLNVVGVPVLGDLEALLTHRIMPYVDLIVVTIDPSAAARVDKITSMLATLPNRVTLLVDRDDDRAAGIAQPAGAGLAPLDAAVDADRVAFAKRAQDLVIGVAALVALSPVMALIAIAIKVDSPGPVFFRQRRHGFDNEEIQVWKFRTMRYEATDPRAERQVTADDPRVTRIGRVLRRTSLDEIPQLLNVLRDEMSLVGPRPHAIGMRTGEVESARLVAEYAHRHRIKPGMTGWAAINGSRGPLDLAADVKQRVALDVDYIERQSFWFDLKILLLTIPHLLGDRSAVR